MAVAVLAAARIRASLSGWYENVFWGGVIGFLIMFLVVQLYPKGGFKARGVRRSDRRSEEGRLLAAGPYAGGHDALIIVRAEDEAGALALLEDDPFNQAGFIAERIPREWSPVIGRLA